MTACDRTADLQSLEVPVSELSASVVGHIVAETENEGDEPLAALSAQSSVPILDLAPRVAVILQEVFSAVAIETPPLDQNEPARTYVIDASAEEDSPLSPVAGAPGQSEATELAESDPGVDDTNADLGVRRQMFRTDI
jgi:hypothetical protein